MSIKLHLLTAVTRPENLPAIEASFASAQAAGVEVVWHQQADPERQSVGGQSIKNTMLDQISDGWVYILDDDNICHPDLFRTLRRVADGFPGTAMIAVSQQFTNGHVRVAHAGMLRSSHVDAGQVIVRREAIGDWRIPEHYCGDGDFIERLAGMCAGRVVFVTKPAAYYNYLRAE
jgi:hypothetical protein